VGSRRHHLLCWEVTVKVVTLSDLDVHTPAQARSSSGEVFDVALEFAALVQPMGQSALITLPRDVRGYIPKLLPVPPASP
jgi:hypothetical protein